MHTARDMAKEDTIMAEYRGVTEPNGPRTENGTFMSSGWREGVNAALGLSLDTGTAVVPATGDSTFVRAFAEILRDNQRAACVLVQDMSPRDRALLSWALKELSYVVDDAEDVRRMSSSG
jgi:hypothetical protein